MCSVHLRYNVPIGKIFDLYYMCRPNEAIYVALCTQRESDNNNKSTSVYVVPSYALPLRIQHHLTTLKLNK